MLSGHRLATQRQGLAFCAIIAAGCMTPFIDAASAHTGNDRQIPDAPSTGEGKTQEICNRWSGTPSCMEVSMSCPASATQPVMVNLFELPPLVF